MQRTSLPFVLLTVLGACQSAPRLAGDITDTKLVTWTRLARGVHVATLGDLRNETRYSDLAAAPPRLDSLNARVDTGLADALARVRYSIDADGRIAVRIPTETGERIHGYGLQFDKTMHSRRILELKVDHFNKGGGKTHAPVPFFVSSRGYGVLFDTARYLKVHNEIGNRKDSTRNPEEVDRNPPPDEKQAGPWLARPPADAIEASVRARGLALVGFSGTDMLDVVARYNLFSGGGAMPPLWGLGFWHRTPAKYDAAQTERELAEFDRYDIPIDVIGLEPGWQTKSYPCTFEWQPKRFPSPGTFVGRLLDQGVRTNLWVNPYVSKHAPIHDALYPLSGSHMVWLGIVPDYTLPEARAILLEQHQRAHLDIGVSGYKVDEVDGYDHWLWPDHATFPSGTSAETMRQSYGMHMQNMLMSGLFQKNDRRTYSLVRATNGACSAYPFVIYSDSYGHDQYVTGLSSASFAGVLWCPEIRSAGSEREWINRMHTVCLSPLAQLNAWASGTKPWSYPNATDAVRRMIQLRMQLLPYLYTAFARYHLDGIPPIRSLLLDPDTHVMREDNSMFLFGPDILVAPFLDEQTERVVRLPSGDDWYDFHTGRLAGNGATMTIKAEHTGDMPPMFVRDGALIPMLSRKINRTRDAREMPIEVRHYGRREGSCELYEDDTETFAYTRGVYRMWEIECRDGALYPSLRKADGPSYYGAMTLREMTAR